MNTDIRLSVFFLDHPKTVKLKRRLGFEGIEALLRIWTWAALHKPLGDLGRDADDIEIAARWGGEPGALISELESLGWIDVVDGKYALHDWKEHQPEAMRRYRYLQSGGYDENGNRLFPEDWQDIKAAVYRRYGHECQYCGNTSGPFHIDHVIPRIKGGADTLDNLVVACASCNLSKGSKSVAEWLGVWA